MPFGALSVLAMPLNLDAPFLTVMGWGIDRMVDVAILVAGWSEGITANPLLAGWTLALGLLALAWFAFFETHWRLLGPALVVPLILLLGFDPRPDALISDTTQAVAIRDGDSLALATGRTGSFAVDVWSQNYQTEIAAQHPGARCDGLGCIVKTPDYSIAIVTNAAAYAEDCGQHDLVIARVYAPAGCNSDATFIGPSELRYGGVHWLHWDEAAGQFEVRPAIPNVSRPWRVSPR
jgi:competence protein ComEC